MMTKLDGWVERATSKQSCRREQEGGETTDGEIQGGLREVEKNMQMTGMG